jgi:hypothetical protein
MRLSVAMLVMSTSSLAGCAGQGGVNACLQGEERSVAETVYFGTNIPGGGQVSADEWFAFRDTVISPRFPDGSTSFKAEGQWRNNLGVTESESTYVLQVVHSDSPETGRAIGEVASLYQKKYRQEAVLRVRSASCISLNRATG